MKRYVYPDNGKFIYKTKSGSYHILKKKRVDGKIITKFYGAFKDYNDAILHRDKCVEGNWDMSLVYSNPMKFIQKRGKRYHIQRRGKFYGAYSNVIDAMNERDLLEANDWDLDKVCELTDDRISEVVVMMNRRV